jgi:hypothetical protein
MSTAAGAVNEAQAREHLRATREAVLAHCASLTPEQWAASDGPGRWTAALIIEHLAVLEQRVAGLLENMLKEPPAADWRERTAAQEGRLAEAAVATKKAEAPPVVQPRGEKTPAESLAEFAAARERLLALAARRDELEQRVRVHPLFGEVNGWQWLRLTAYHSERHLAQMRALD